MITSLNVFLAKMKNLIQEEHGQDLVEYALIVALIALVATAGMKTLATGINAAFTNISAALSANIT